jgi:hypothetical protein
MEFPSGNIHLFRSRGGIQDGQLFVQLRGMTGLNSGFRTGQEKFLDPLMPKAANHSERSVLRNATLHNT